MIQRCLRVCMGALLVTACTTAGTSPGSAPDASVKLSETPRAPVPASALAAPSPSPSPSPVPLREATIRLATGVPSAAQWHFFIAERKGFNQKYALKVPISAAQADPKMVEGLGSANFDAVAASSESLISAIEKGAGLTIAAGGINRAVYSLIVAKEINGYGDLKGKLIGISDPKAAPTAILKKMLANNGLPETHPKTQVPGGTAFPGH